VSLLSRERRLVQNKTCCLQSTAIWLKGKANPREAGHPGLIPGRGSKKFVFLLLSTPTIRVKKNQESEPKKGNVIKSLLKACSLSFKKRLKCLQ